MDEKLNIITDYELEFMSLQITCNLYLYELEYANLIHIPKSYIMHLMDYV